MEHVDLEEVERRPQQYWNIDGLPELVMGVLWIIWGGANLLGQTVPHDWRWNAYWTAVPAILVISGFVAVRIIKRLKARLTFPRAGYVEWKEPSRATNLAAAAVAMITAMVLVVTISNGGSSGQFAAPILGGILSLGFLAVSIRQRAPHYLALAAVALVLGLVIGRTDGGWPAANWLFVAVGAAAALAGGVRLAIFLKRFPRPSVEGA